MVEVGGVTLDGLKHGSVISPRPPCEAPTVSSRLVCPDLHSFVHFVSPVSHQPAVLDEGRRSRHGRLIKPPLRD